MQKTPCQYNNVKNENFGLFFRFVSSTIIFFVKKIVHELMMRAKFFRVWYFCAQNFVHYIFVQKIFVHENPPTVLTCPFFLQFSVVDYRKSSEIFQKKPRFIWNEILTKNSKWNWSEEYFVPRFMQIRSELKLKSCNA